VEGQPKQVAAGFRFHDKEYWYVARSRIPERPPQRCNRCHCVSVLFHPDPDLGTPAAPADRRVAVLPATGTSFLVILISFLAVRAGWWAGGFLDIPRAVLIAVYLPFSITGYALWLGAYRWLARRTRHAFWIYTLVVLVSSRSSPWSTRSRCSGGISRWAATGLD
jgi:hypothetical protein